MPVSFVDSDDWSIPSNWMRGPYMKPSAWQSIDSVVRTRMLTGVRAPRIPGRMRKARRGRSREGEKRGV
jgi:hypothetical protein